MTQDTSLIYGDNVYDQETGKSTSCWASGGVYWRYTISQFVSTGMTNYKENVFRQEIFYEAKLNNKDILLSVYAVSNRF